MQAKKIESRLECPDGTEFTFSSEVRGDALALYYLAIHLHEVTGAIEAQNAVIAEHVAAVNKALAGQDSMLRWSRRWAAVGIAGALIMTAPWLWRLAQWAGAP